LRPSLARPVNRLHRPARRYEGWLRLDQGVPRCTKYRPFRTETGIAHLELLRATARPCIVSLCVGVAGCQVSGDGPWMNAHIDKPEFCRSNIIDLTPTDIVAYRPPPSVDRLRRPAASAGGHACDCTGRLLKVRSSSPTKQIFPHPAAGSRSRRSAVTDEGTIMCLMPERSRSPTPVSHKIDTYRRSTRGQAQDPRLIVEFVATEHTPSWCRVMSSSRDASPSSRRAHGDRCP